MSMFVEKGITDAVGVFVGYLSQLLAVVLDTLLLPLRIISALF